MGAVPIDDFLRGEGFEDERARRAARGVLEAARLTNPRKQAMDEAKLQRAREVLAEKVLRVCCAECQAIARAGQVQLRVARQEQCQVCEGSNNRRAALHLGAAMRSRGASKLLIVGGTGTLHRELQGFLAGSGIEVRGIDATARTPSQKEAWADQRWADLVVVWASTPLPHKVSELYTREPVGRTPLTVARRGIEALCTELRTSLERHGV